MVLYAEKQSVAGEGGRPRGDDATRCTYVGNPSTYFSALDGPKEGARTAQHGQHTYTQIEFA